MKIIRGNHHITDTILKLATDVAKTYFSDVNCVVGIFQSTRDFITISSPNPTPAIIVGRYDNFVTMKAHPFIDGSTESFCDTQADYLICISDKGKFKNNLPAIIAHELKHVVQNQLHKVTVAQCQCLAIKLKNTQQPPHERDAKLFEEKYFGEPKTIPENYDWLMETEFDFESSRQDFEKLLDLFLELQKSQDSPPIFEKQPEGINIPIAGEVLSKEDLNYYIHNLRVALNRPYKITRDKSADLKRLKVLQKLGLIEIHEVQIESQTNKNKRKVLPVAVWDHTKWGESVWAGDDNSYDKIRELVGKHNVKDAITLEAHIRNQFDYFITEDKDEFISNGRRKDLEDAFPNLVILTVSELEKKFLG